MNSPRIVNALRQYEMELLTARHILASVLHDEACWITAQIAAGSIPDIVAESEAHSADVLDEIASVLTTESPILGFDKTRFLEDLGIEEGTDA